MMSLVDMFAAQAPSGAHVTESAFARGAWQQLTGANLVTMDDARPSEFVCVPCNKSFKLGQPFQTSNATSHCLDHHFFLVPHALAEPYLNKLI
jgi:hypothetical protein